jgi:hypothetical protein
VLDVYLILLVTFNSGSYLRIGMKKLILKNLKEPPGLMNLELARELLVL